MKTQALVVSDDPVYLSWLQKSVPGIDFSRVRPNEADDPLSRNLAGGRIDVVFVQFAADNLDARAAMVERLVERYPGIAVAGISDEDDPPTERAAIRAGARDFLVLRRDADNAASLISRMLKRAAPPPVAERTQQRTLAVMGPYPHESIAFLAEHVALASAEKLAPGQRTLLIDLAAPYGGAAAFLNLETPYGVLDALQDVHRFDATLIDSTFPKHRSGVYVLGLQEDLNGPPHLDEDELLKLLNVASEHFACTVVAIDGHKPVSALGAVCSRADRSMVVTEQSILQSRHVKHFLRAMRAEQCPMEGVGLVVDNYRKRLSLDPQKLAETFGIPLLASLATQPADRLQAMNTGSPLFTVAPRDEYCAGVRALLAKVTGTDVPRAGGLLGKLFS
ncbi:MAG: AAA family ATPase [Panacagrimonas sp.]